MSTKRKERGAAGAWDDDIICATCARGIAIARGGAIAPAFTCVMSNSRRLSAFIHKLLSALGRWRKLLSGPLAAHESGETAASYNAEDKVALSAQSVFASANDLPNEVL
jgi:hypothetical protein